MSPLSRLRDLTKALELLRAAFGIEDTRKKLSLLDEVGAARLPREKSAAKWMGRLHEVALFIATHPDNDEVSAAATRALTHLFHDLAPVIRKALADTGIAGTEVVYPFDHPIAAWLAARFPNHVKIGWKGYDDQEKLQTLLQILAGQAEELAIDDDETTLEAWMKAVAGGKTDLSWLVDRLRSKRLHPRLRDDLFDALSLPIAWAIQEPRSSRTLGRVNRGKPFYHTEPLDRATPDLGRLIRKPVRRIRPTEPKEARELCDLAKSALTVREREMFPISHADESAVTVFELERGLEIVTFGTLPERRLLLEGLWGYLFLKNGWPIGYGCYSAVFGSAEVAFNIFDSYRQGESALTYGQLLRVIHAQTGATSFSALKYQFGDENAEAIKSGAFWFYDKLGFRHLDPDLKRLAENEREAKARTKGYRTPPATLRRLATRNLYFHLGRETRDVLGELRYPAISLAVTNRIGARHGSDREEAISAARARVKRTTGASVAGRGYYGELAGELALFLDLFDLERWSATERREAGRLLIARANSHEAGFVRALGAHRRLKAATMKLMKLSKRG